MAQSLRSMMGMKLIRIPILMILLLALIQCSSKVDSGTGATEPGTSPMRRLTRTEYNNTVKDLLGDTSNPADQFAPESRIGGFDNNADALPLLAVNLNEFLNAAVTLSENAVTNHYSEILGCSPSAGNACAKHFIENFGMKALRSPLSQSDKDRYFDLFTDAKNSAITGENAFKVGIKSVLMAFLVSPRFLNRVEEATSSSGKVAVTDFEMASRLSYFIWNSMPDDELLDAAKNGNLKTSDQIREQAERMLEDSKAKTAMANFLSQWFRVYQVDTTTKDSTLFPEFTNSIRSLMKKEAKYFFESVWEDGNASTIFDANYTYMNDALADYYGVPGPGSSSFKKVTLNSSKRAGALTLGAVMAGLAGSRNASPTQRGKMIYENIQCGSIPPPNGGDIPQLPPFQTNQTNREHMEAAVSGSSCQGCHQKMDPLGFAFEHYSAAGKWISNDINAPSRAIKSSVTVSSGDLTGSYSSAVGLTQKIAETKTFSDCMAKKFMLFALGRSPENTDTLNTENLQQSFKSEEYDLKALVLAVVSSTPFMYKKGGTL